jgi:hypothetical protein
MRQNAAERTDSMRRLWMMVVGMCLAAVSAGGCGQDADGRAWWNQVQDQQTPTDTRQLQDTMGGHDAAPIVVTQTDAPTLMDHVLGNADPYDRPVEGVAVSPDGNVTVAKVPARYVQFVHNEISYQQSASTTPTATATATPTVTGTQDGTQSPTTSPTYRVDPGVAVPVAVGLPGSAPTATGNAAGSGSASQEATVSNQLTTRLLDLAVKDPSRFAQIAKLLAGANEAPPGGADTGDTEVIDIPPADSP